MHTPLPLSPLSLSHLLISLSSSRNLPKGQQLHAFLLKTAPRRPCTVRAPSSSPPSRLQPTVITPLLAAGPPRPYLLLPPQPSSTPLQAPIPRWSLPCMLPHSPADEDPGSTPSLPSASAGCLACSAPSSPTNARPSLPPANPCEPAARPSPSLWQQCHYCARSPVPSRTSFAAADVLWLLLCVDMYAKWRVDRGRRGRCSIEMPERTVVLVSGLICGSAQDGAGGGRRRCCSRRRWRAGVAGRMTLRIPAFLRVCAVSTLLELGSQVHCLCVKSSYEASPFVGSSLISLYSKCGLVEFSYKVFDEMPDRNLGAWNAILIASAQHGHTDAAFERFGEMERVSNVRPNFITFLCLLTACSHAGLVKEGKMYFKMMSEQHGIEPGHQHYATIVDLLSRAGKLKEAVEIIETMPIPPTESVWGALLTGCRLHNDTDTAAFAAEKLFETWLRRALAHHMLLTNAYAAAGKYADAARARKAMRDKGVKKETGLSWLEATGGKVYTFVSGDRSNSRSEEIYRILEEVGEKMEMAGYVADTSFVLRDVDREEKRRSVWYHSERLAIGFGLLTVPEGRPIRVMKNLRVCGDCHTAIKFVSKVTGRVVILRDNNRFHRFEDGVCSCGDYW
ncbi:LOW QUALITY PROTEIN: putative pentatricopeptide repeat-containing protein At5g52630 [Asparagus officinalis]|uniref:LOW QUALITY PROTEIN: putative pentatricopeptide repeat-containing protein At5g52630 n=1 Tax=Asparagus officinalis TaxID=4686 RepID=UPI00098E3784|nr:LOW QUALITY PROTEIN: putative pentatricopeptide repeat-containing protein At5g52630 [Asparagus officinalis]